MTTISAFANASLYLFAACTIFFGLANSKFSFTTVCGLFLIAVLFSVSLLNLSLNFSITAFLQVINFLLPWFAITMVLTNKDIILNNYKSYWSSFNYFLVVICFLGLCEYIAVFMYGYRPTIMKLETGMGNYYVGYFTLFQNIEGLEVPYFRFQGPFGESGDLAMWASIFLIYNIFRQQYICVFILLFALFGAFSPSALISLFVAFLIYIYSRSPLIMFTTLIFSYFVISIFMSEILFFYTNILDMKVGSLADRALSNIDFLDKFSFLINTYPFGIPFFESTNEKLASGVGFSTTYGPIGSYMIGGLIAFLIYLIFALYLLIISTYKILFVTSNSLMHNELYIYYIMLFTYVIQRGSFFEYALSPFLFAPIFFVKFIKNK